MIPVISEGITDHMWDLEKLPAYKVSVQ